MFIYVCLTANYHLLLISVASTALGQMNAGTIDLNPVQKVDICHHQAILYKQSPHCELIHGKTDEFWILLKTNICVIMLFKLNEITVSGMFFYR
jgi:hypothetical protein